MGGTERFAIACGTLVRGEQLDRAGQERNAAVAEINQMVDQAACPLTGGAAPTST